MMMKIKKREDNMLLRCVETMKTFWSEVMRNMKYAIIYAEKYNDSSSNDNNIKVMIKTKTKKLQGKSEEELYIIATS